MTGRVRTATQTSANISAPTGVGVTLRGGSRVTERRSRDAGDAGAAGGLDPARPIGSTPAGSARLDTPTAAGASSGGPAASPVPAAPAAALPAPAAGAAAAARRLALGSPGTRGAAAPATRRAGRALPPVPGHARPGPGTRSEPGPVGLVGCGARADGLAVVRQLGSQLAVARPLPRARRGRRRCGPGRAEQQHVRQPLEDAGPRAPTPCPGSSTRSSAPPTPPRRSSRSASSSSPTRRPRPTTSRRAAP